MTNLEFVSAIAGALFGLSVLAHLLVMLLTIIGLLWSPIAAAIADRHRADTGGSAKAAASMFLPWLYARKNMLGDNQMAPRTVRLGYGLVYMLWLLGPSGAWAGLFIYVSSLNVVSIVFYLFLAGPGENLSFTDPWRDASDVISALLLSALTGLIAYACLFNRRLGLIPSLKRIRTLHSGRDAPAQSASKGAVHPDYLVPFVRAIFWSFASPVLFAVVLAIVLPIRGGAIIN